MSRSGDAVAGAEATPVKRYVVCGSAPVEEFLDLGETARVDNFLTRAELSKLEPRYHPSPDKRDVIRPRRRHRSAGESRRHDRPLVQAQPVG
jgi:hypothetical protein